MATATRKLLEPEYLGPEAEILRDKMLGKVVGQDEAVNAIVDLYQTYLAGMSEGNKPLGSFLFMGPTGTGKTKIVEATAQSLLGYSTAIIKVDCAEFQHSHEIAKLIGSPPGYLGHRETHPMLSQEFINQYHTEKVKISFILFDEIEKASDALWNLLLGIMDKAILTLGDNRRVDFSRSFIFMTSNLGSREMEKESGGKLGFSQNAPVTTGKLSDIGIGAARKRFSPEFMNRIDRTVVFQPLTHDHMKKILDLELANINERIWKAASGASVGAPCILSPDAREYVLAKGIDPRYGARNLKRLLERELIGPISNLLATKQLKLGDVLKVEVGKNGDKLEFYKETRKEAVA